MEQLSDYHYDLPEILIAQVPLEDRSASRLLVLDRATGTVSHHRFVDCLDLLHPGDLLVLNDTRVSAVRLAGRKTTGGAVEALLLREVSFNVFEALVRPAKTLRVGAAIQFPESPDGIVVADLGDGLKHIRFEAAESVADALTAQGRVPLPPYIHERLPDPERYQTVYGSSPGSAAAPTAGLHFTPELLDRLRAKGVEIATVTLHVGLDTFRPVQVTDVSQHVMHGETCHLSETTAEQINRCRGCIVAVGTTSVRTLESFSVGTRRVESGWRDTRLFIRPGYDFQIIDGMFTNFHLPETTMLMMISALAGREQILHAYAEAVAHRYRFLSFGDSMLIL